ncbi:MAG: hypothetical protein SVR94_14965, partial [Pseudomonadota bacterium]|nr:hypothetical protein [Pseudomonadota bacterium]
DGEHWSKILILLSMDRVIPFYRLMGLHIPDTAEFINLLRHVILENYKKQVRQPHNLSVFVTDSIGKIAEKFGEDSCLHLLQWGRFICAQQAKDYAELHSWKVVLAYCHSDPKLWESLGGSSMFNHEGEQKFLASQNMTAYEQLHQKIYEQPLSDWDLCWYALRKFDDEDPDAPHRPDQWVYHTVLTEQNRNFWVWVLTKLNSEQQTILQKNASTIGQKLKIKEALRHPRFLGKNYEYRN